MVGPQGARTALRAAPAGCHCERFGCAYEAFLVDTPTPAYDFFWDEFRGEAELRTIVPNGAMFVKKRA